jgi:hypothetical protein
MAHEHGASILMVASMLLLLLGMAAIAIDTGAGFNERRASQTSSDVGVIAGAMNFPSVGTTTCGGTGVSDGACNRALEVVRANLDEVYSDTDFASIWRDCRDPVKPAGFAPLKTSGVTPWDLFLGTDDDGNSFVDAIDCISASQTELRLRLPDQFVDTAFGGIMGVDEIHTFALAHAGIDFGAGPSPIIPFGALAGATGLDCILEPPSGFADPPCVGGETGSYGALLTQLWGSTGSIADCGNSSWPPGADQLAFNIAFGMDHPISNLTSAEVAALPADADAFDQAVNTGDVDVDAATVLDRCKYDDGEVVGWDQDDGTALDVGAVDTVRVDSGASMSDATLKGFITGDSTDFTGFSTDPSNLQARIRYSNDCPVTIADGELCLTVASQDYLVDDVPLWEHLDGTFSIDDYTSDGVNTCDLVDDDVVTNSEEMDCVLRADEISGEIFDDSIETSLRFVWIPEFHYDEWGTGIGWQPIVRFKSAYIHAFWFNTPGPDVRWAPMGAAQDVFAVNITNPNALITVTAFLIPDVALPPDIASECPVCADALLDVELIR